MEFSYRISEAESLKAWKLRGGKGRWPSPLRMILFWVFILICLMVLWTVVQKAPGTGKVVEYSYSDLYAKVQSGQVQDAVIQGDELRGHLKTLPKEEFHTTLPANYDDLLKAMIAAKVNLIIKKPESNLPIALLFNLGPFVLLAAWIYLLTRSGSRIPRAMYREDPTLQGEFTVEITPQGIATRNTAGTSTTSGWNIYNYWREGKDLIVLVMRSGGYFTLNLAGLPDLQRNELRGILATALPRK